MTIFYCVVTYAVETRLKRLQPSLQLSQAVLRHSGVLISMLTCWRLVGVMFTTLIFLFLFVSMLIFDNRHYSKYIWCCDVYIWCLLVFGKVLDNFDLTWQVWVWQETSFNLQSPFRCFLDLLSTHVVTVCRVHCKHIICKQK